MKEERLQEVIKVCQEIISIPSYSGHEGDVVNLLEEILKSYGFNEVIIDEYGSIIGKLTGKQKGPKILLDAHIDTVVVPDPSKWHYDPFGGVLEEGRIYGRGTTDMKGALAAMIIAASYFSRELNYDFAGEIYVAGVVHEECFEGIAARSISKRIKPDYVIIGEASELNIKCGQRGRAEIVVETYGKPAHSANPETGINAVYKMTQLIPKINQIPYKIDPILGKGILELTDIISTPYPGASVVPDKCRVTYDRRLLVGEAKEEVLAPLQAVIEELEKENPDFKAVVKYAVGEEKCHTGGIITGERFFPAWRFEEKDDFVQAALKAAKQVKEDAIVTQYSFCTNGSHYAGEAGIKTLGFGPSKENLAHTIDEYVEVSELIGACHGYVLILKELQAIQ
ncbi:YgeY family selenium metabolism-linked hydrolase [Cellulosilyticum sp. I15G10I2]|uniref:YgeY family selenium metabolism-linked hydrolase n=1 Tax=Cellulosilyticum sp. I15G10I2 TaxID=1892843 RepID=UPI00085C16D5|nr:YgeY family selenium metabolism-linked hydrolase [Cellulosilyticum sp. I15G10I2]